MMGDCLVFTLQAEMNSPCCTSEQNKNIKQEIQSGTYFYPSGFDWTGKSDKYLFYFHIGMFPCSCGFDYISRKVKAISEQ